MICLKEFTHNFGLDFELGRYETEEYAAAVYNFAAAVFFGEYRLENRSEDIPTLSISEKANILSKCAHAAENRGWCIRTAEYQMFCSLLAAA